MPTGPFSQDILTRIINVQWGAAIYVMGDESGQIFSSGNGEKTTDGDIEYHKVFVMGTKHEGVPPGQCNGTSSARVGTDKVPAIVVGGHKHAFDHISDDGVESGHYTIGMIAYSGNGTEWENALDMGADSSITVPTTVLKIIWDQDRFYCHVGRGLAGADYISECWTSTDGKSWGRSSGEHSGTNTDFERHCKYKDQYGSGFADGEFGIDPSKKDSHETFPLGKVMEDGLLITREDLDNSPVTFANGTWARGNYSFGQLETSTDSGMTWTAIGSIKPYDEEDPNSGSIRTLIGAPL